MTISNFVAYVKQAWKNKPDTSTPLSAARLTHLEDGIKGNSDAIEKIAAAVVSQIVNDPNKIASMASLYSVNQAVTQLNSDLATKVTVKNSWGQDYFSGSKDCNTWIPAQGTSIMCKIGGDISNSPGVWGQFEATNTGGYITQQINDRDTNTVYFRNWHSDISPVGWSKLTGAAM